MANIWARDRLKAGRNSGDLRCRGNPTLGTTTNSWGDVSQIGE